MKIVDYLFIKKIPDLGTKFKVRGTLNAKEYWDNIAHGVNVACRKAGDIAQFAGCVYDEDEEGTEFKLCWWLRHKDGSLAPYSLDELESVSSGF